MKKSQNVGTKSAFTPKIFCNLLTVGSHKQNQLFISCKKIYYILFHSFLSLIVTLNLFFFFFSILTSHSLPLFAPFTSLSQIVWCSCGGRVAVAVAAQHVWWRHCVPGFWGFYQVLWVSARLWGGCGGGVEERNRWWSGLGL